jgi:hypothetical protein
MRFGRAGFETGATERALRPTVKLVEPSRLLERRPDLLLTYSNCLIRNDQPVVNQFLSSWCTVVSRIHCGDWHLRAVFFVQLCLHVSPSHAVNAVTLQLLSAEAVPSGGKTCRTRISQGRDSEFRKNPECFLELTSQRSNMRARLQ